MVGYYGRLFTAIDTNRDGDISDIELRALIVGIQFEEIIDLDCDDAVNKIMKDFDTSRNNKIEKIEFVNGISKWLNKITRGAARNAGQDSMTKILNDFREVNWADSYSCSYSHIRAV